MLSVLLCVQPYTGKMRTMALQRVTGSFIGALYGLAVLLLQLSVFGIYDTAVGYTLTAFFIIPIIYTTVLLDKKNASYFSCVVYLSIVVNHIGDQNPYIFVLNRLIDTFIGIAIGLIANSVRLPRRKMNDRLFVARLDDMLTPLKEELEPYSKVEINRMTDDGMKFTVATMRTPAGLIKPLSGINMRLPVIVMDGAALYDINENSYLRVYIISNDMSGQIVTLMREKGLNCFINALADDTLVIFYKELQNEAEKDIYKTLRRSPYRCYMKREPSENDRVVYLMAVDKNEKILTFYEEFKNSPLGEKVKILCYPSDDYEGYSYIKIYNKNASCRKMASFLAEDIGVQKTLYVGTSAECDVKAENSGLNAIAKTLKHIYEPLI